MMTVPSQNEVLSGLRLGVIVAPGQRALRAVRELRQLAPEARFLVGPDRPDPVDRMQVRLKALEGRVVSPVDQGEPVTCDPLEPDALDADLIVDLRPGPPDPDLARRARHGSWTLGPLSCAGFIRGEDAVPVCWIGLRPERGAQFVVGQARVQPKWLVGRTETFAREKAIQLLRRELARLALTGTVPDLGPVPPPLAAARLVDLPGHLGRMAAEALRRALLRTGRERFREIFGLRLGYGTPDTFDVTAMRDVTTEPGAFEADPFLFEHDGALYCFYEELPSNGARGVLSVARIDGDDFVRLGRVLEAPHHLSYPHVFAHEGEIFMIPETLGARRVEIWRATDFPMQWTREATALDGRLFADPVLFRQDDRWWFMASPTHDSVGDCSSEVWLFRADGPTLGRLDPHPLNPVVVGSDAGRGGGRVIAQDGRLLRMAQDNCGPFYGHGLRIMEITELTPTTYAERELRHITGDDIDGAVGIHHVDFAGGRVIADIRWS